MKSEIINILYVDDFTGEDSGDVETVTFSLNEVAFEVDLNKDNRTALSDVLARYIEVARKVSPHKAASRKAVKAKGPSTKASAKQVGRAQKNAEVREWAKDNGFSLGNRGRIPERVYTAHENSLAYTAPKGSAHEAEVATAGRHSSDDTTPAKSALNDVLTF